MMTSFDEREQGYERKFEHDQELAFKVKARRNKLVGLWTAGETGLTGDAAETFAHDLAEAGFHHSDDELVVQIVAALTAKNVSHDAARVRMELEHFAAVARKELGAEG
jgi:hypothetical protein